MLKVQKAQSKLYEYSFKQTPSPIYSTNSDATMLSMKYYAYHGCTAPYHINICCQVVDDVSLWNTGTPNVKRDSDVCLVPVGNQRQIKLPRRLPQSPIVDPGKIESKIIRIGTFTHFKHTTWRQCTAYGSIFSSGMRNWPKWYPWSEENST